MKQHTQPSPVKYFSVREVLEIANEVKWGVL
jgi:hypothetical protein